MTWTDEWTEFCTSWAPSKLKIFLMNVKKEVSCIYILRWLHRKHLSRFFRFKWITVFQSAVGSETQRNIMSRSFEDSRPRSLEMSIAPPPGGRESPTNKGNTPTSIFIKAKFWTNKTSKSKPIELFLVEKAGIDNGEL